jgi:hypothetical protein
MRSLFKVVVRKVSYWNLEKTQEKPLGRRFNKK